ncbi:MAG: hypothetical protein C0623_10295 [Desulfuromonas sp.]|nr:MAG: hypothetical protein C0623_10295 [Desulfuromonas sp.]
MNWRKWNHALHRDIGYLCIGLTLIYALSGIAVNHIRDWNPNYKVVKSITQLPPSGFTGVISEDQVLQLLGKLGEKSTYDNIFQNDPESVMVFVEGRVIQYDFPSGKVVHERIEPRSFWYPLNFLHLNHPKKAWTWMADLYAGGMILLALTGLLLLPKGRMRKRCLILTAAGCGIPILFLMLYY